MKSCLVQAATAVLTIFAVAQAGPIQVGQRAEGYQNVAYYTSWSTYSSGRNYQVSDLPASKLTMVLYAFAKVQEDGTVVAHDSYVDLTQHYPNDSWNENGTNAYGNVKQLYLLKKANRNLKVLLSIGGWTLSETIPAACSDPAKRERFAQTAVATMRDWGFDGIDIDWEYPKNTMDGVNYSRLLNAIRWEMELYKLTSKTGYNSLLTIAGPAGPHNFQHMLDEISATVDYINLMGYDYAGGWDKSAGHQANLRANWESPMSTPFNTDRAISAYLAGGVPPNKIILGMPCYGRAFTNTEGLGKNYSGIGNGTWDTGVYDYSKLPKPGAQIYRDEIAGATYSYDNVTRELISFDTAEMVKEKVQYIKDKGLGGSMFWEASGDRTDELSLISTSYEALGMLQKSENQLQFRDSRYDNIAKGMP